MIVVCLAGARRVDRDAVAEGLQRRSTDGSFIPHQWTLSNYSDIFKAGVFTDALRNSIGIALISTLLAVLLASAAAYAIARLDFPGKRDHPRGCHSRLRCFPQISLVGPLYNLWRQIGLYDTWPGLIIPYMTFALPLSIFTLSAFFREIPWELEQAAQVDGATPFQAFRKVIAPLATPGIATTVIIVFIICWNDFMFAISLTSTTNAQTVPAAIASVPRRVPVHAADRRHRRGCGRRDRASHAPRDAVPAPDRGRTDRGGSQGLETSRSCRMAEIEFEDVTKRYPDGYEAVKHIDLDVADGELMILVGPSGCGKSTALRMVAGLEDISDGELKIGGRVVNDKAPKDRDIAMVFQNYALYPHMTVRENMGFALKLAKVPEEEIDRKVMEAAKILDLEQHLDRKPANLSGGQRQRVAMGRAIVRNPSAFLMDEPLSNLDAKLRVQMRTEIARIQQQVGTTTIYVTHDQTEAMTLGDRIAVMRAGMIQQVGRPSELYSQPKNLFVAGFIGSPSMNFLPGELEGDTVHLPIGDVRVPEQLRRRLDAGPGGGRRGVIAGLRPEDFEDASLVGHPEHGVTFRTKIEVLESMGSEYYAYFEVESERVSSAELEELAQDAGAADLPHAGTGSQVVARLECGEQRQPGRGGRAVVQLGAPASVRPRDLAGACLPARAATEQAAADGGADSELRACTAMPESRSTGMPGHRRAARFSARPPTRDHRSAGRPTPR